MCYLYSASMSPLATTGLTLTPELQLSQPHIFYIFTYLKKDFCELDFLESMIPGNYSCNATFFIVRKEKQF